MCNTQKKDTPPKGTRIPNKNQSKYSVFLKELQEGSQSYLILKHLIEKGSITSLDAFFDYRITRLSGRIFDLREMGIEIESEMISTKNNGAYTRYAKYRLKEDYDA